jgi:SAM-dependent methyltransferase
MATYALDNASPHGTDHLGGLSGMFDQFTTDRISETTPLSGRRCLELGAGNGSVAVWLADRVGADGRVVAVDIEPQHIPEHNRLTVLCLDLTRDPLPPGPFDFIHTRLVLGHLPNRDTLLPQLCGLLAPGGAILLEEFNVQPNLFGNDVLQVPAEAPELGRLWDRYNQLRGELFTAAGTASDFAVRMHRLLLDAGLVDVQTVSYCRSWRGGEPGSWHATGSLQQFRPMLAERGFDGTAVDALVAGLANPQFQVSGRLLNSTSGYAPR